MNALLLQIHAHEATESLWDRYMELVTDPAHLLLELTIMVVVDLLILGLLWPFAIKPLANRWLSSHLAQRDEEHGHDHD